MKEFEGPKYQETKELGFSEIYDIIKKEIKAKYGKEYKLSIVKRHYGSFDVTIKAGPLKRNCAYYDGYLKWKEQNPNNWQTMRECWTDVVNGGYATFENFKEWETLHLKYNNWEGVSAELLEIVEGIKSIILDYYFDDSDAMTDYFNSRFYYDVGVADDYIQTTPKQSKPTNQAPRPDKIQVVHNEKLNGIEISFPTKPDADTIETLKHSGFRWSPKNMLWYRRYDQQVYGACLGLFQF